MATRWLLRAVLILTAAISGWYAWQLRRTEEPPPLVGPPRSDYTLDDFELITLDEHGEEAFAATGPQLARHPFLGTLTVNRPRLRFSGDNGEFWNAVAAFAWIAADNSEVRLERDVHVTGPESGKKTPPSLETSSLSLFPKENRIASDAVVTIADADSILRGRGLRADIDTRRLDLLADVTARYEPKPR